MPVAALSIPERTSLIDLDRTFLPIGHMRQISQVTLLEGSTISAEMELGAGHWVWPEHFPADPIFPGTLMLEGAGQLLALWAWANGERGRPRLVRISGQFLSPVGPDAGSLSLKAEVQRKRGVFFGKIEVTSGEVRIAEVDAALVVLRD